MKKFLMAAVAASFISAPALAVQIPSVSYEEGGRCSAIHDANTGGINVVELSDYRKCVMVQHDIDTAFTYKTFWVRMGDQFTSFKVDDLAKLNNSERAAKIVEELVAKALLDTAEERIDVLESELMHIEAEKVAFKKIAAKVPGLEANIEELNMQIKGLNGQIETLGRDISVLGLRAEAVSYTHLTLPTKRIV